MALLEISCVFLCGIDSIPACSDNWNSHKSTVQLYVFQNLCKKKKSFQFRIEGSLKKKSAAVSKERRKLTTFI